MCFEPFYSLQSSIRNTILAKNASLLTPAMDVYCAAPKCDDAAIRAVLASFVQQCPPDYIVPRANSSTMVQTYAKQFYEINYAHDTLCGKDANGIYCQVNEYTRLLSGSNSSQPLCNLCVKAAKINVISYIYTHPPADYPFLNGTAISASQNDTIALLNRTCGVDYSNSSLTFNGSIPVQTVGSTSAAPGRLDVEVVVPVNSNDCDNFNLMLVRLWAENTVPKNFPVVSVVSHVKPVRTPASISPDNAQRRSHGRHTRKHMAGM
ncbi:hypothetical protein BC938DRAFT_479888 [Jimgerdemannia flammicorona]|uniref:Uncharacterized protein n=1 Tax=Jimgerdemannia flammicorona TaxID=994334 RepID=A0A433QJW6_9FUNG|nr:hypothetical protein BC938DRAFT_479888 [Jimgerdemannia flammicorona]